MPQEKRYYVQYTGADVIVVGTAGKFMPGTRAYVGEVDARALVGREDFVVHGIGVAPAAAAPAAPPPVAAVAPSAPELAKTSLSWRSERTRCDTRLSRWGHAGRPVLIIPPGGGDAGEIERMGLVAALHPLIAAGQIKVYSCDAVADRALVAEEGTPQHRMWLLHMFQEYIAREVVPAIRADGVGDQATVIAAGAALGAMHAAALVCRYPDMFSHALCASGTYRLEGVLKSGDVTDDLLAASPLLLLPRLGEGRELERLRSRFVLLASGEGNEDIDESRALAQALGDKGVPNRLATWGKEAPRGWRIWSEIFSRHLAEWASDPPTR